jgi:hypothetical protein
MKPAMIVAVAGIISLVILVPVAYALTPRSDFGDNISTYRFLGGTKVCGEHLCNPGEWNRWVSNMFFTQVKKLSDSLGVSLPDRYVKSASYDTSGLIDGAKYGKITRISTFAMNDGKYTSFVSVTNTELANADYIKVSQLNSDVKITKAWITPQWESNITLYKTVFETTSTSISIGDTINMVFVTDGKPAFSLDTLASHK